MKFSFLIIAFLFFGCSSAPLEVPGPDGTPHKLITCLNIADCYRESARVCGGKYTIVHSASQNDAGASFHRWQEATETSLLIKCGEPKNAPTTAPTGKNP